MLPVALVHLPALELPERREPAGDQSRQGARREQGVPDVQEENQTVDSFHLLRTSRRKNKEEQEEREERNTPKNRKDRQNANKDIKGLKGSKRMKKP